MLEVQYTSLQAKIRVWADCSPLQALGQLFPQVLAEFSLLQYRTEQAVSWGPHLATRDLSLVPPTCQNYHYPSHTVIFL